MFIVRFYPFILSPFVLKWKKEKKKETTENPLRSSKKISRLERNLGFVVACMPILRPLIATMLKINSDRNIRSWDWYCRGQDEKQLEHHPKVWEREKNIDDDNYPLSPLLPKALTRTTSIYRN